MNLFIYFIWKFPLRLKVFSKDFNHINSAATILLHTKEQRSSIMNNNDKKYWTLQIWFLHLEQDCDKIR